MKIMMIKSTKAASRSDGAESKLFEAGSEYSSEGEWQTAIFSGFVKSGMANEIGGNVEVPETKKANTSTKKRATNSK
jgi:hypothetical protein